MNAEGPIIRVAPGGADAPAVLRVGVPLPRGWLADPARLVACVADASEGPLALQGRPLARWSDGSIRWLLADVAVPATLSRQGGAVRIRRQDDTAAAPGVPRAHGPAPMQILEERESLAVRTAGAVFSFDRRGDALLRQASTADGQAQLGPLGLQLSLTDDRGEPVTARIDALDIESDGPLRTVVRLSGGFGQGCPLSFVARWEIDAASTGAVLELRIRNPRAARHVKCQWDLGDPGSVRIGDLSLALSPAFLPAGVEWQTSASAAVLRGSSVAGSIYQDSSGGEHWDSPNHREADGSLGVRLRGYRVEGLDAGAGEPGRDRGASATATDFRAQPVLAVTGGAGRLALSVQDFWQNFPKALRVSQGRLSAGLFPRECGHAVELQGGEQKRHRISLAFGDTAMRDARDLLDPPQVWVDPEWVEASRAVQGFVTDLSGSAAWTEHVRTIVDGPQPFAERREAIDEYGWRNFGDLWADHEAVHHTGAEPFVSHYNNQYDFLFAAGVHAMRTGDARWDRLARECALHTADIDVYHTDGDRAAFNGGLFWHSDHYLTAGTATHRTYSAANAQGRDYGGGPSNEHNYAAGLLLHHYRTGDPDALECVVGLADWVIAMDDGARTLFALIDAGPTGFASQTLDPDYHGPGRGAGNSIAVLLDGFAATGRRRYMDYAEALIRRCVHPNDDVAGRGLDDVENRWSYLVFLQVLGRYLDAKREAGEIDFMFHYARESLLVYADWVLEHEVPYKEVLHKVEMKTESWSAHDIRKCHVLHLAARHDLRGRAARYRAKAGFFYERCLQDLDTFETRHLTRPLVLLAAYGHLHAYFERAAPIAEEEKARWRHSIDFGVPVRFVRQRDRLGGTLRERLATTRFEVLRTIRERFGRRPAARRARDGASR